MKLSKKIFKYFIGIISLPILYLIGALILSEITVNKNSLIQEKDRTIYLTTNGVHLDIVLNVNDLSRDLLRGLKYNQRNQYFAFGWGDENFYLNTPTMADLTFGNAFEALFLRSSTLIHLSRYSSYQSGWMEVKVSESQLGKINEMLLSSFKTEEGRKIHLKGASYSYNDDFYKAKGSYSCFYTCNSWVNHIFKESGLKACLWTPFDFGLLQKYKQ